MPGFLLSSLPNPREEVEEKEGICRPSLLFGGVLKWAQQIAHFLLLKVRQKSQQMNLENLSLEFPGGSVG